MKGMTADPGDKRTRNKAILAIVIFVTTIVVIISVALHHDLTFKCPTNEIQDRKECSCMEYTRRQENGMCEPNKCTLSQILMKDGACQDCPQYTKAQLNGKICGPDQCYSNWNDKLETIGENGQCKGPCNAYSKVVLGRCQECNTDGTIDQISLYNKCVVQGDSLEQIKHFETLLSLSPLSSVSRIDLRNCEEEKILKKDCEKVDWIRDLWEDRYSEHCGGNLLKPLSTMYTKGIETPLKNMIQQNKTTGFFYVENLSNENQIKQSVWILQNNLDTSDEYQHIQDLSQLKSGETSQLSDLEIRNSLNGFVRGITSWYFTSTKPLPLYLDQWFEGQVKNGEPNGFGRYVTTRLNKNFIGYLKPGPKHVPWYFEPIGNTQHGTGLYYEDFTLTYSGYYDDDQYFGGIPRENPDGSNLYHFKKFTQDDPPMIQ